MAEEAKTETKKKSEPKPEELTPSGLALAEVGAPKDGASEEELVAHADKYLAAKLKARRG